MEHPFNRVMLATEHTDFDSGAERVGLALAQRCGIALDVVMPVTSNPEFEVAAPGLAAQAAQTAANRAQALQDTARSTGVQLNLMVRSGPEPAEEILAASRECLTDLLITRRRGKRGLLARLLVGEMVSQVVAQAPCSVLMVPENASLWRGGVIAAIDDSTLATRVAAKAAAIAARCNAPLTLVHIGTERSQQDKAHAQAILAAAAQAASGAGTRPSHTEFLTGKESVEQQIISQASRDGAELIVVGRNGMAGSPGRLGSTAHRVIGLSPHPVLVVHG